MPPMITDSFCLPDQRLCHNSLPAITQHGFRLELSVPGWVPFKMALQQETKIITKVSGVRHVKDVGGPAQFDDCQTYQLCIAIVFSRWLCDLLYRAQSRKTEQRFHRSHFEVATTTMRRSNSTRNMLNVIYTASSHNHKTSCSFC